MQLQDFNYDLPESAIALHPAAVRGGSRLLTLSKTTGAIQDRMYKDVVDCLQAGDVLVINNTKVIPARLAATTEDGAERELLLLEQHGKATDHHTSLVMYRKRLRPGQMVDVAGTPVRIEEVYDNGTAKISSDVDLWQLAQEQGEVPLPPYMHRREEQEDRERYQTEFAKQNGSVAAPTASLNLTNELLDALRAKGVQIVELTLHVGLGTFMPIRVDDVTKHKMHQEYFEIPLATAQAVALAKQEGRRVVTVGTTVTRTLEYAAEQISKVQPWNDSDVQGSTSEDQAITGEADIFIYPGYQFKMVDGLLTNFHAPHSTVLMMAAAFAGWDYLHQAYVHALRQDYKFLSYGDSMLIA
jgi:S-adenosylmethionine:tRNA ribosyltransferase-isomerase